MRQYLRTMPTGIQILWCYVIWYLVMVIYYFDTDPVLWRNSLGLSIIVGIALVLATGPIKFERFRQQFWQVVRLFLCPFCVSSFSGLTKSKGFLLLLSSQSNENVVAITACGSFCIIVFLIKKYDINN